MLSVKRFEWTEGKQQNKTPLTGQHVIAIYFDYTPSPEPAQPEVYAVLVMRLIPMVEEVRRKFHADGTFQSSAMTRVQKEFNRRAVECNDTKKYEFMTTDHVRVEIPSSPADSGVVQLPILFSGSSCFGNLKFSLSVRFLVRRSADVLDVLTEHMLIDNFHINAENRRKEKRKLSDLDPEESSSKRRRASIPFPSAAPTTFLHAQAHYHDLFKHDPLFASEDPSNLAVYLSPAQRSTLPLHTPTAQPPVEPNTIPSSVVTIKGEGDNVRYSINPVEGAAGVEAEFGLYFTKPFEENVRKIDLWFTDAETQAKRRIKEGVRKEVDSCDVYITTPPLPPGLLQILVVLKSGMALETAFHVKDMKSGS